MYPYLIELARRFPPGIERETGIGELAALFHCSARYTKTIMKQLHQQGTSAGFLFKAGARSRLFCCTKAWRRSFASIFKYCG